MGASIYCHERFKCKANGARDTLSYPLNKAIEARNK